LVVGTIVLLAFETREIRRIRHQFIVEQMFIAFFFFMNHITPFFRIQLLMGQKGTFMWFFHRMYHGVRDVAQKCTHFIQVNFCKHWICPFPNDFFFSGLFHGIIVRTNLHVFTDLFILDDFVQPIPHPLAQQRCIRHGTHFYRNTVWSYLNQFL
jgi:hypothetical protein